VTNGLKRAGVLALASLAIGACSENSGTNVEPLSFDAEATQAGLTRMSSVMDAPAYRSFVVLAPRFGQAYGSAMAASVAEGAARIPVISVFSRGRTFVYDPALGDYAPSERSGAPANGARIILYEFNPVTGVPNVDREIGHADLMDEGDSDPARIALRFRVTSEGTVALDYAISLLPSEQDGQVDVSGFLTDGATRLDFDVALASIGDQMLDIDFAFDVNDEDFHVVGDISANDLDESGTVTVDVRHGSETVRVDMEGDGDVVEGTFWVNGLVLARASGDKDDPTITAEDGRALTINEVHALLEIVAFTGEMFELFEDLLEPAEDILELGFVL